MCENIEKVWEYNAFAVKWNWCMQINWMIDLSSHWRECTWMVNSYAKKLLILLYDEVLNNLSRYFNFKQQKVKFKFIFR